MELLRGKQDFPLAEIKIRFLSSFDKFSSAIDTSGWINSSEKKIGREVELEIIFKIELQIVKKKVAR